MATAYNPSIITSGLILCFDAGNNKSYPGSGTTWIDMSGMGYNGTLLNGVGYTSNNQGTLTFDGTNDHISITSPTSRWAWTPSGAGTLNNMTIDMWVNSTDTGGQYLSKPWNDSGVYNYRIQHDLFFVQMTSTQAYALSFTTSLSSGKWEHVCCVVTPTQMIAYRNGIIDAGPVNHGITTNTPESGNLNRPLCVMTLFSYNASGGGTGWSQPTHAINGSVAAVKIYNRALSAAEVAQNYSTIRGRFGI